MISTKTSIIISTFNRLDLTIDCLETIKSFTDADYEIIVVDNHSTDGTAEWLQRQYGIKTIFNSVNLGYPSAYNQGIRLAAAENDILLLDNDTLLTKNWLFRLREALHSANDIGACGPLSNNGGHGQSVFTTYKSFNDLHSFAAQKITADPYTRRVLRLNGFCMLIKRKALDMVGLLDETFCSGSSVADDYCIRLALAGYRLLLCENVFVHHYGLAPAADVLPEANTLEHANNQKFREKWGFVIPVAPTDAILEQLEIPSDSAFKVLEIGCGCGSTLLEIKNRYSNALLYGCEPNPEAAKIAELVANVRTTYFDNIELHYQNEQFDYVILDNVLPYLIEPWSLMQKVRGFLAHSGIVIISVPNIMHYSIVKSLIIGKWENPPDTVRGMRRLRHFSLSSTLSMLSSAGYKLLNITPITLPSSEDEKTVVKLLTDITSKELEAQYLAHRYVVSATKK